MARNAALAHSTGDCIAFLDSDDEWFDFKLALQVEALERLPDVAFLFTEFVILKDDGSRIHNGSRTWLAGNEAWSDIYPQATSSRRARIERAGAVAGRSPSTRAAMYRQFMDEALVLPTTAIVRRDALGIAALHRAHEDLRGLGVLRAARARSQGAFLDVETAVNRGHSGPERLTRCSGLAKAQCYLDMLERVWLRGCRVRAPVPAGPSRTGRATRCWRSRARRCSPRSPESRGRRSGRVKRSWVTRARTAALAYSVLASLPGGRSILRSALLSRRLLHAVTIGHGSSKVNPAA